jgi:hypothetical protein
MSLADALSEFQASALQCDNLIANAHQLGPNGICVLPAIDRRQITVAAFLNLFVSWETFLESIILQLMVGGLTTSGKAPNRFVSPPTVEKAVQMVVGVQRYFDYGNHDYVRKMVGLYFEHGYPFEPHLGGISSDLADLRTMRNASAHITSTTAAALEALAQRVLGTPHPGIELYTLLTSIHPASAKSDTVFVEYKQKLLVVAGLVATG